MGDMADFTNEEILNGWESDQAIDTDDHAALYDAGLEDELGYLKYSPLFPHPHKSKGPGNCPNCGAPTVKKNGKYGEFYGCTRVPECKGNRNL